MGGLIPQHSRAAACNDKNPERFVEFLPTFSESKGFSLNRTILPLALIKWEAGLDSNGHPFAGPTKSVLSASEYWRWPTLNQFMEEHGLFARLGPESKSVATLALYKDAVPGVVTFHFKRQKGCWQLWQYEVNPDADIEPQFD